MCHTCKEVGISLDFANISEILHRFHLGINPIHTAWFLKFRGKYIFLRCIFLLNHNIFVLNLYLQLCKQKKTTFFKNNFNFIIAYSKSCFWIKRFNKGNKTRVIHIRYFVRSNHSKFVYNYTCVAHQLTRPMYQHILPCCLHFGESCLSGGQLFVG